MALDTVVSEFLQRWTNLLPPNTCYPPPTPLLSGSRLGGDTHNLVPLSVQLVTSKTVHDTGYLGP